MMTQGKTLTRWPALVACAVALTACGPRPPAAPLPTPALPPGTSALPGAAPGDPVYACYQRWRKAGIWEQIVAVLDEGEPRSKTGP